MIERFRSFVAKWAFPNGRLRPDLRCSGHHLPRDFLLVTCDLGFDLKVYRIALYACVGEQLLQIA
jgi:hypothetical protein